MHTSKSRSELKVLAKKNDVKSARILAREVVRANKQRDRLISSKARIGSVQMQLQHQLCMSFDSTLINPRRQHTIGMLALTVVAASLRDR